MRRNLHRRFQTAAPATLPVTGGGTQGLLALAGLVLFLGGVAIRFGETTTGR